MSSILGISKAKQRIGNVLESSLDASRKRVKRTEIERKKQAAEAVADEPTRSSGGGGGEGEDLRGCLRNLVITDPSLRRDPQSRP
ncbi:hypothetical protein Taro_054949 [Colocasia esculenta]|uniref:Uncharacterized protein n=1 Tax=Colocasia esculenta TaxID=4460 RepID=A0A843XS01_COLES|nr:hypothetical protein [Colocasia esculenta]